MRRFVLPILLTFLASSAVAADLEANKKTVLEFYEAGLNKKDFEAAAKYFGPKYIQHNPGAPDGIEGFKGFLAFLREKFPNSRSEIKRVFAEGDYVILHVHAVREPGTRGRAIVDISASRMARSSSTGTSRRTSQRRCRTTTACSEAAGTGSRPEPAG